MNDLQLLSLHNAVTYTRKYKFPISNLEKRQVDERDIYNILKKIDIGSIHNIDIL